MTYKYCFKINKESNTIELLLYFLKKEENDTMFNRQPLKKLKLCLGGYWHMSNKYILHSKVITRNLNKFIFEFPN